LADLEQVALVVAVERVAGRWAKIHRVAEHPEAAHLEGATARQVAVQEQERGAKRREQAFPKRLEELPGRQQRALLGARVAERLAQRAPGWRRKAEPQERQPPVASPPELAPERQPAARLQPARLERPVSELPQRVAAAPVQQRAHSAREPQPDASVPPSPLHPSRLCPPWLSLRRPLLHPQRREGACEPSRRRQPESSWSASFFLVRRTRARGR